MIKKPEYDHSNIYKLILFTIITIFSIKYFLFYKEAIGCGNEGVCYLYGRPELYYQGVWFVDYLLMDLVSALVPIVISFVILFKLKIDTNKINRFIKGILIFGLFIVLGHSGYLYAQVRNAFPDTIQFPNNKFKIFIQEDKRSYCRIESKPLQCVEQREKNQIVATDGYPFHYRSYYSNESIKDSKALLVLNYLVITIAYITVLPILWYAIGYLRKKRHAHTRH